MSKMFTIMAKELRSYFVSPVGYVALAFWLFGVGFFFALDALGNGQASLQGWFGTVELLLLFIGPALTMRLLADEQRTGTMEVLMTSPVRNWQVVIGKFLGALAFFVVMIACTLVYPLILVMNGNPDLGPIFTSYLGLLLLGGTFLAVGVFTSSLSDNQVLAYISAFILLLVAWIIGFIQPILAGPIGTFLTSLSVIQRFDDFTRGILDFSNILFYLSFMVVALFATIQILEARRARL